MRLSRGREHGGDIDTNAHRPRLTPSPITAPAKIAVVLADGSDDAALVTASVGADGWISVRRSLAAELVGEAPSWPTTADAVVAIGADPLDLADVADRVRSRDEIVPLVVLGGHPDGELLSRLLRLGGGRIGYGLTTDDAAELLVRAETNPGCVTSAPLAEALLARLGGRFRDHDRELAAMLLAGGGRRDLVAEVARRPDLLAAVVDDAAGRALKRLALAAAPEDRAWLALVLGT